MQKRLAVLDFSKIEAGKLDLETKAFDLRNLMDGLGDMMGLKALEKGLPPTWGQTP